MILLLQALVEILLLSGGTPYANFKDLAYAWGREWDFIIFLLLLFVNEEVK